MKTLNRFILAGVALLGLTLASPAQARDHHRYYGRTVYYRSYPRPYYSSYYRPHYYYSYRRPVVYYDDPYYYDSYRPGFTIAFGGSHWSHHHHHR
jgi:hypothetical protein